MGQKWVKNVFFQRYFWTFWGAQILHHVSIYGLALFVVCMFVRVVCMCVCVLVQCTFLHWSPQASSGSHVESSSVISKHSPGQHICR